MGIMEKKMETTIVYWGYLGIMENRMETTIVYWRYMGIMESKMETTIVYWGYVGFRGSLLEVPILKKMGRISKAFMGLAEVVERAEEAAYQFRWLSWCTSNHFAGIGSPGM